MKKIRQLLISSKKGIAITGETNLLIRKKMWQLSRVKGARRWLLLVEILELMTETKEFNLISSGLAEGINSTESDRMDTILNFVVQKFRNVIRISHASKLLVETNLAVTDISNQCGFNKLSNFNRHFSLLRGISPLNYRKQFMQQV